MAANSFWPAIHVPPGRKARKKTMPTTLLDDKVWWDRERKLRGICLEVAAIKAIGGNVLLLAHFEGTLVSVEATLMSRAIESNRFSQFDSSILCSPGSGSAGNVWSGLARSFQAPPAHISDQWGATRLQPSVATPREALQQKALQIIVAEHHPMRSRDQQLHEAAATLTCEAQLTIHISLDDALLTHFGVRSIQDLYRRAFNFFLCSANSCRDQRVRQRGLFINPQPGAARPARLVNRRLV